MNEKEILHKERKAIIETVLSMERKGRTERTSLDFGKRLGFNEALAEVVKQIIKRSELQETAPLEEPAINR